MSTILIVDDSQATRTSLKFSLTMKKYDVLDAGTAREAIRLLQEHNNICLVITDMNMPGMDGFGLIKHIREELGMKTIPIIALTTAEDKGKQVLGMGASAFIMKSSKASEEILSFIARYIDGK